jgi:hypothetical protein
MDEAIHLPSVFDRNGACDVEAVRIFANIGNDTSDLAVDIWNDGIVEAPYSRLTRNETSPSGLDARSQRRDDPHAGHDNARASMTAICHKGSFPPLMFGVLYHATQTPASERKDK